MPIIHHERAERPKKIAAAWASGDTLGVTDTPGVPAGTPDTAGDGVGLPPTTTAAGVLAAAGARTVTAV